MCTHLTLRARITKSLWARSYMFSVHNPGKMFSEHVLGTRAFILRALWNVLGTHSFKVENGTHLGLRSMTYCVYTAQRARSFWCALSVLIAVCVLSPAHLEHCSRYTSVHTCFGCVLRGRFVPRTWFDHVPAGTVLAGTILFRTRSDYKKWCVPRTCSENMFGEHVPAGTVPRTSMNARYDRDPGPA